VSKLYLVPTPIGNLADMTYRAVEVLRSADLILAEDTRTSGVLLKHYGIDTKMRSYHAFNEHETVGRLASEIASGVTMALITDAGTPGISDPGYLLVQACIQQQIPIETLPGATAFVPALVNSGLPAHEFTFTGFLPPKKGRETRLKKLAEEERTLILYESPHRLMKTLEQCLQFFGERPASASRELSKKFEETVRGSLTDLITHFSEHPPKGEFVLVIGGKEAEKVKKRQDNPAS